MRSDADDSARAAEIDRLMMCHHTANRSSVLVALMQAVMAEGCESSPESKDLAMLFEGAYFEAAGEVDASMVAKFDFRRAFELGYKVALAPDATQANIAMARDNRDNPDSRADASHYRHSVIDSVCGRCQHPRKSHFDADDKVVVSCCRCGATEILNKSGEEIP